MVPENNGDGTHGGQGAKHLQDWYWLTCQNSWCLWIAASVLEMNTPKYAHKWGYPRIIHLNGIVYHYQPSILYSRGITMYRNFHVCWSPGRHGRKDPMQWGRSGHMKPSQLRFQTRSALRISASNWSWWRWSIPKPKILGPCAVSLFVLHSSLSSFLIFEIAVCHHKFSHLLHDTCGSTLGALV